jgi:2-keto-4-pentenoate hydratase
MLSARARYRKTGRTGFTAPIPARPGETFRVDYGKVGSIAIHFS